MNRQALRQPPLRNLRFVDGARGLMSLIILVHHFCRPYLLPEMDYAYGLSDTRTSFLQLPLARLLYSGFPIVAMFFLLSGFVLSYRPLALQCLQPEDAVTAELFACLSSVAFRRGIRLFLPAMITTFVTMCTVYWIPQACQEPPRLDSFRAQVIDWKEFICGDLLNVWSAAHRESATYRYDPNLWTITPEFTCSMLLLLSHLVMIRKARLVRLIFWTVCSIHTFRQGLFGVGLFHTGALIADLTFSTNERSRHLARPEYATTIWTIVFLSGGFLASYPEQRATDTFVYSWLPLFGSHHYDEYVCWQMTGATLMMLSLAAERGLQKLFEMPVLEHFGRLSYAVYLCHGLVLRLLQPRLISILASRFGPVEKPNTFNLLCAFTVLFPVVWALAWLFWRLVDEPTARYARRLETSLTSPNRVYNE